MSNKIRNFLREEVLAFTPVLHECYRVIGRFQKSRGIANERAMRMHLEEAGARLQEFRPYVQPAKQPYFLAVMDEGLGLSDRIVALDIAVGAMHIEFPSDRSYSHRESAALRQALERARDCPQDAANPGAGAAGALPAGDLLLCRGIPASPGVARSLARIIGRDADYEQLLPGSIVVARTTRPEMIFGLHNIAGIVTDAGGSLCHAAIVAREKGIPCVVGTGDATGKILDGWLIDVDGTLGTVSLAADRPDPRLV